MVVQREAKRPRDARAPGRACSDNENVRGANEHFMQQCRLRGECEQKSSAGAA